MACIHPDISLDDKYTRREGRVYLTGTQALLLMLMQRKRLDERRGLKTAGFISGYRGSPMSSVDSEAWLAEKHLKAHNVRFIPGVNEDLAATSVWGTQQAAMDPRAKVDGVFALWYGKGAGLDRCGDVMRHGHGAGSSRTGGVLVVSGDDHALKSSSQAYHSEPTFIDWLMPVLYPSDIEEMITYGLYGWEMSRFSGNWVGLKVLAEMVNSTSSVPVDLDGLDIIHPDGVEISLDRWIRWPDPWPNVEKRIHEVRLPAALAFAKANKLDRAVIKASNPRLGIVAGGKSYCDVVEALATMGMSLDQAAARGLSIYKVAMPWPLETDGVLRFCNDHEKIMVVEEKRDIVEAQIKSALFDWPDSRRPKIIGRRDEDNKPLFPSVSELTPDTIARAIGIRLTAWSPSEEIEARLAMIDAKEKSAEQALLVRQPYFCSGCPHSVSTKVPDGSRALAGVGCHFMAVGMDRRTETFTQMGGEGATWIGTAPFTATDHVFVNMGEGTYFHSGSLAIRAAVAAGVTITYKILFNGAVAMTGGQPVDGELTVPMLARQLRAEGVDRIEIVADDPSKYGRTPDLPTQVRISSREDLDRVQRDLRAVQGVSVLIFDQMCATEKRRRRKRGQMPGASIRIVINEMVCEGCGDCSVSSNCLSVVPSETDFGRKRSVDQSSCNQDYSCLEGFCPSFVTVKGAVLPKANPRADLDLPDLPLPQIAAIGAGSTFDILVTGVGGTGVVTIGAIIAMAAHLEGKGFSVHDRLGMAQKFGSVYSHVRLANLQSDIKSVRIPTAHGNVTIGADLAVAAEPATLRSVHPGSTKMIVSLDQSAIGEFTRNPDYDFKSPALLKRLRQATSRSVDTLEAKAIATAILGDAMGANMLLLGYAWQKGLLPVGFDALDRAIQLNGVAVEMNRKAFALGRYGAIDLPALRNSALAGRPEPMANDWRSILDRRSEFLTRYQDADYAERYRRLVVKVADAECRATGKAGDLAAAVARYFAKLMSYKDEYEVARLYTDGEFQRQLKDTFGSHETLSIHLAPPLISRNDPITGQLRKRAFGPWVLRVFSVLAKLRCVRGTRFDIFGYQAERRLERQLIDDYEALISELAESLAQASLAATLGIARIPERIRGYGHVKLATIQQAYEERTRLLQQLRSPEETLVEAAE